MIDMALFKHVEMLVSSKRKSDDVPVVAPPVAKKARADESVLQIIMDVACVAAPTAQGTLDRYSHLSEKAQIANATKFLSQK